MTPYNLVHMAALLGLDLIALTDHNTCGNCRSAMAVGKTAGITVVPGMELTTAEDIHVVCLFPDLDHAEAFSAYVQKTMLPFSNNPDVFGHQRLMDEQDGILGEEARLLMSASGIAIDSAPKLVQAFGGVCYPAHVERPSFSLISVLGSIEQDMGFGCAEISRTGDIPALQQQFSALRTMRIMRGSDAHYLENMCEPLDHIPLDQNHPSAVIAFLRQFGPTPTPF